MCSCVIVMRPELKIVLVAVEIIVVIAAALALEQCGTGSGNSDKGYISGEYQEKIILCIIRNFNWMRGYCRTAWKHCIRL